MNKLAWTVVAAMLTAACAASVASDLPGTSASSEPGAIYEWIDDGGRMHASDSVPEKYKSVARRIDPNRTRLSTGELDEAERQASALKAKAASAVPQTAIALTRPGAARSGSLSGSQPAADTPECAAWRRQVSASRECFVAFSNRHGSSGLRSCSNEPDPPPPAACAPDASR